MSSEPIISLRNVSKTFRAYAHPLHRLIARFSDGWSVHHKEFHALNGISFDIQEGETVGLIGRNGSGKSTLLQIICGIRQPTSGSIRVNGRISALLELGSGFQPEFTGRENIFLQGAIMGFSREKMEARFDDIAVFADIGEFIDQPVRTYSSGMFVRLAFSVAIHVDPDILIIDEALAVGDELFQRRCMEHIDRTIADRNTTVLLVSHNLQQIERFCQKAIWLEDGHVKRQGMATNVCAAYHSRANEQVFSELSAHSRARKVRKAADFELLDFCLIDVNGAPASEIAQGGKTSVLCRFSCARPLHSAAFGIGVHTSDALYLATENSGALFSGQTIPPGVHTLRCTLDLSPLLPDTYALRLGVSAGAMGEVLFYGENLWLFRITNPEIRGAEYGKEGYFDLRASWSLGSPDAPLGPCAE